MKNKGATKTAKLNVACPKTSSKLRAVGARRLVRVEKKREANNRKK